MPMKIDFAQTVTAQARAAALLAEARARAEAQVIARIDAATLAITGPVPLAEQLSWTVKEEAARAALADAASPAQTALLSGEADVTGEALADLAAKIVANADAYRAAVAHLAGLRRLAARAIADAPDAAALAQALADLEAALQAVAP